MSVELKYLSYDGLSYLIDELKDKFVQQEANKGLSENDFTNILRDKLSGIENNAEKNVVHSVNNKTGQIIITANDIEFLSSVSGATPTNIRAAIDKIKDSLDTHETNINKKADKATTYTKDDIDGKLQRLDTGVTSVNGQTGSVTLTPDMMSDTETKNKFTSTVEKDKWNKKAEVGYVDSETAKKVDKVQGKQLSTNDFTSALNKKLNEVESGAQVNKIELIKRNGANLPVTGNKTVDIEVPTKVSEITNDRGYQTKAEVRELVAEHGKLKKEIVTKLPEIAAADSNTMYLIRNKQDSGYEEWMIIGNSWEILGDTAAVDFTGYIHEDNIGTISNKEIDTLLSI